MDNNHASANTRTQISGQFDMQRLTGLETVMHAGRFGADSDSPLTFEQVVPGSIVQIASWADTRDLFTNAVNTAYALALPEVGNSTNNDNATILWTGPDRYLLVSNATSAYTKLATKIRSNVGSVLEMSSSRCVIRVSGADAVTLLQKGVPVDLSDNASAAGSVVSSSVDAHVNAILHKRGFAENQSFDIYAPRSYAVSLWEWLTEAALEFGFEVKS